MTLTVGASYPVVRPLDVVDDAALDLGAWEHVHHDTVLLGVGEDDYSGSYGYTVEKVTR